MPYLFLILFIVIVAVVFANIMIYKENEQINFTFKFMHKKATFTLFYLLADFVILN